MLKKSYFPFLVLALVFVFACGSERDKSSPRSGAKILGFSFYGPRETNEDKYDPNAPISLPPEAEFVDGNIPLGSVPNPKKGKPIQYTLNSEDKDFPGGQIYIEVQTSSISNPYNKPWDEMCAAYAKQHPELWPKAKDATGKVIELKTVVRAEFNRRWKAFEDKYAAQSRQEGYGGKKLYEEYYPEPAYLEFYTATFVPAVFGDFSKGKCFLRKVGSITLNLWWLIYQNCGSHVTEQTYPHDGFDMQGATTTITSFKRDSQRIITEQRLAIGNFRLKKTSACYEYEYAHNCLGSITRISDPNDPLATQYFQCEWVGSSPGYYKTSFWLKRRPKGSTGTWVPQLPESEIMTPATFE